MKTQCLIGDKLPPEVKRRIEKMADTEDREIVSVKIVDGVFKDIIPKDNGFSSLKKWFYYKPCWWWQGFSYWVKRKWQRVTTGFAHHESYDYFNWNAQMAIPRLKMLRDNLHGCPAQFTMDGKPVEEGVKEWTEILNKIIWSFENIDEEPMPKKPDDYDPRCISIKYSDGSTSYEHLDERKWDWSESERHAERVQEGLDLYGKYYLNLWD